MGGQSAKEWGPILINFLPALQAVYQKLSKDSTKSNEEKKKMAETLRSIENHPRDMSAIMQNQMEMRRTIEGLQMMLNHLSQNGIVPPNAPMPPNGPVPRNGPAPMYSTMAYSVNPGSQSGSRGKSDIRITISQSELNELLTLITRTLASEIVDRRNLNSSNAGDVDSGAAFGPPRERANDDPSAPNAPAERPESFSQDPLVSSLSCDVCGLSYNTGERKPIFLSECGHTFCRKCLVTISRQGPLSCPTCRRPCRVRAEDLPTNFAVLSLVAEQISTIAPINGTHSAVSSPSEMLYDKDLEHAISLSLKEYEQEESLRLAQRLQEEENAKAWSKGRKKGKASKSEAWRDGNEKEEEDGRASRGQHPTRDRERQDGMNAYYTARRLMEEEEEEEEEEEFRRDRGSHRRGQGVDLGRGNESSDEDPDPWSESYNLRGHMYDPDREPHARRESHSPRGSMLDGESMDDVGIESRRSDESTGDFRRGSHTPGESMDDFRRGSHTPGESIDDFRSRSHTPGQIMGETGREAHPPEDGTEGAVSSSNTTKHSCKKMEEEFSEMPPMERDLDHYMNKHFYGKDGRKGKSHSLDEETRSMLARALEREQREREGDHKRKTRRLLKEQEQLDLAIAMSLSMQETGNDGDSDKEDKKEDEEE